MFTALLVSKVRDSHVLDLLTAVIEASHLTLPTYGGCWVGNKRPGVSIPGWDKDVKPFRDDSLYWGNYGGQPAAKLMAGYMRTTKKQGDNTTMLS